jgi:hypothetical protein
MGRTATAVVWGAITILGLSAGLYLLNTVLYLTPLNPVKAQWYRLVVGLQHPLFEQNWHLFAPNPVRSNFVLTVRCRTSTGVSAWHDITMPLLARLHRDRHSPVGRLLRVQQNAIRNFLFGSPSEWRMQACRRDPDSDTCRRVSDGDRRAREAGAYLLGRTAAAACDRLVGPGRAIAIQAGILIHHPPPWSRRHEPDAGGTTRAVRLPWAPHPAAPGGR